MDKYKIDEDGYILEPSKNEKEYDSSSFMIITYDVIKDSRLNEFQKLLFAAISGLEKGPAGYCYATNEYFEKLFDKSQPQISAGISRLVELGYVKREIILKRKYDKNGKIFETKQVAFRKLNIVIDREKYDPIKENLYRGIKENQKQINNNIINNSSNILLHKTLGEQECSPDDINELLDNKVILMAEPEGSIELLEEPINVYKDSPAPAAPEKKKGGLAPLLNEIESKYPKKNFPELNKLLDYYIHSYIGKRRLPDLDKWKQMLNQLENYSSIALAGTAGKKFVQNVACKIVEKALNGKDGIPFLEFDDIYGYAKNNVMEPQFNLNQEFNEGY